MTPVKGGAFELHRIQSVFVVRGDAIAAYETDLGPASIWAKVMGEGIFATGEVTVAEVMAEAEKDRHDQTGHKLKEELREGSTLTKDFLAFKEAAWEIINNRSVFGPAYTKQRNGYDKKAALEN
jgi:hypothetical protein